MKHSKLLRQLILLALICWGLILPTRTHCQASEATISHRVMTLISGSSYQEAIDLLLVTQKRETQNLSKSFLFHSLATCYIRLGQFDKGLLMLDNFDHTLIGSEDHTAKVDALTLRAVCYTHYDEKEKALKYSLDALTQINRVKSISPVTAASTYTVLGEIYRFHYSRLLDAKRFFLKADSILASSPNGNIYEQATLYYHLISNSRELLQNEEALLYSRKALTLIKPIQSLEPLLYARILTAIGNVYFVMQDLKTAEEYQKRAVDVSNRYRINSSYRLLAYNNLGAVYIRKANFSRAIRTYRQGLVFVDKESLARSSLTNLSLGYAYYINDVEDSALFYLKKSLVLRLQLYGEKDYRTAIAYQYIGNSFRKFNQPDSALNYYQQALKSSFENFSSTNILDNPTISLNDELEGRASILTDKAKALYALYSQTKNLAYAESAMTLYTSMDSLYFIGLQRNISDREGIQLAEYYGGHLTNALETASAIDQQSPSEKINQRFLQLLESNKSILLYNALQKNKKAFESTPLAQLDSLQKLMAHESISSLERNHSLQQRVSYLSETLNKKRNLLAEAYLSPYTLSIQRIQLELLRNKSCILTYHIDGSFIYAAGISPTELLFHSIPLDDTLQQEINWLTKVLSTVPDIHKADFLEYQSLTHSLFKKLIRPILPNLHNSQVIIMPDGALRLLPFEAFVASVKKEANGFHQLDYWVHHASITYSPSIRVWLALQKNQNSSELNSVLAAYSTSLSGSKTEISYLKTISPVPVNIFSSNGKDSLIELLSNSTICHFALHGVADSTGNKLSLSSISTDYLSEENIYATSLPNTQLAFLGSCKSNLGKEYASEGILSLGRAFLFSGCRNVVASLWELPDAVTGQLVTSFYKKILLDMSETDDALRHAKVTYLQQADALTAHPHYWSGLTSIGIPISFTQDTLFTNYWLLFALLMLVYILIRIARMRVIVRSKVDSDRIG